MNIRDRVVSGKLRMLLRMYEDNPYLALKEAKLRDVLSADDLASITSLEMRLMSEAQQLNAPIGALLPRAKEWDTKRVNLIKSKRKFLDSSQNKRRRGKLTAPWFYKESSKIEDEAARLAHEFSALPQIERDCFVTKSHPHYRKPKPETENSFQVALPYPRYGYEHRDDLHNICRTAHMTVIAEALNKVAC